MRPVPNSADPAAEGDCALHRPYCLGPGGSYTQELLLAMPGQWTVIAHVIFASADGSKKYSAARASLIQVDSSLSCPFGAVLTDVARALASAGESGIGGNGSAAAAAVTLAGNTAGECAYCPKGTYADPTADTANRQCKPCAAGTFAFTAGATQCIRCDTIVNVGTTSYQDTMGQSECKRCPANTARMRSAPGLSINECLCEKGYYQAEGKLSGSPCVACPAGAECPGSVFLDNRTDAAVNASPHPIEGFWGFTDYPNTFYPCANGAEQCKVGEKAKIFRPSRLSPTV